MSYAAIHTLSSRRGSNEQLASCLHENQRSIIHLSRSALIHNINHLITLAHAQKSQLGIVIKSDAYGHGMLALASELEHVSEVTWLCTAGIEEAIIIRQAGSKKNLLSMTYIDTPLDEAIHYAIDVTVDDVAVLAECNAAAERLQKSIRVHLKIDTGLSRLGIFPNNVIPTMELIRKRYPWVSVYGIFTHLSDTNNRDLEYTYYQLNKFKEVLDQLKQASFIIPFTHALSSGGLTVGLSREEMHKSLACHYSLVRVGTNVYGLYKSHVQKERLELYDPSLVLQPILTWKSSIVHSEISRQQAIVPVGYADGYPQILAHKAHVLMQGSKAPVVEINSDYMVVDVSAIPTAQNGDEVTLIGQEGSITAQEIAHHAQTINNELLTRINPSVKRIVCDGIS